MIDCISFIASKWMYVAINEIIKTSRRQRKLL
nr:MAG TPA: hypothetical protein [Caudoviricetes sp.]